MLDSVVNPVLIPMLGTICITVLGSVLVPIVSFVAWFSPGKLVEPRPPVAGG